MTNRIAKPDRSSWLVLTITIGPPFLRWDSLATAPSPTDADIYVRGQGELMIEIGVVWAFGGAGAAATTTQCTCTIVRAAAISAQRDNGGVLGITRTRTATSA